MKNKLLYLGGLLIMGMSILVLIYMQSEFVKDYLPKLLLAVICVAIVSTLIQIFVMWLMKKHRKGPIFFINSKEDEEFIQELESSLRKKGCICYPTHELILSSVEKSLVESIRTSRLIVILLAHDYEESPYIRTLLKIVKKEKCKNIVFFTRSIDVAMPQLFRQAVPIILKGDESDVKALEDIIFNKLTKF